ncbi:MAG: DUF4105 domain-containing protein [Minisyncoccia bacterium]
MKKTLIIILFLLMAYLLPQASHDRDWTDDQKKLSYIEIENNQVSITNVRSNTYRSTDDYDVDYYDLDFNLDDIVSVDYVVEPFGTFGAAHALLSFGLESGEYFSVSVEIRKEKGESFNPIKGLLKQYELVYVIADERDVIDLRARHRKDNVYLYPTTATPDQAQKLFLDITQRVQKIYEQPEFYNTITNACTTNIVRHVNNISDEKDIRFDPRIILPGNSDELALELGFLNTDLPIAGARQKYRINEHIENCDPTSDGYSACIRK